MKKTRNCQAKVLKETMDNPELNCRQTNYTPADKGQIRQLKEVNCI